MVCSLRKLQKQSHVKFNSKLTFKVPLANPICAGGTQTRAQLPLLWVTTFTSPSLLNLGCSISTAKAEEMGML